VNTEKTTPREPYRFEVIGSEGGFIFRNPPEGATHLTRLSMNTDALAQVPIHHREFGQKLTEMLNAHDHLQRMAEAGERLAGAVRRCLAHSVTAPLWMALRDFEAAKEGEQ